MYSPKTRPKSSSSTFPPPYISRAGVDQHAIEIHSKRPPVLAKQKLFTTILMWGLVPQFWAHLYKNLHSTTLDNLLNISAPGALWMIQIWLQVYFLELRFPDIVMLEDRVILIPLESYRSCNKGTSLKDADDLDVHKDCRCTVNKINNIVDALYPSWEPNSYSSGEFDPWWKARFASFSDSSIATKGLFANSDAGIV
ncbi:unnamed protein product [Prunus armeniaca]